MTEQNKQFDEYGRGMPRSYEQAPDRLRKDLRGLFEPAGAVPPQVDRAILDQARRRLAQPRRIILRIRWAGVAAAAAVIAIGALLYYGPASSNQPSTLNNHKSAAAERRLDLDGNGRVDILDAFWLARRVESRGPDPVAWASRPWLQDHGQDARATEWDINNDGRVNRDDVDAIARAAVRLDPVFVGCVPRTTMEQEKWCVIRTLPASQPRRLTFRAILEQGV